VLVSNFDTTFTFQMHGGTLPSADGMAFVLQGNSPHALGGAGGGLGYGSDTPGGPVGIPNSIAVKFDLFSNAGEGTDSTGLFTGGHSPTIGLIPPDQSIDLTGSGIDLHSQDVFQVHLTYDGTTLTETITDETLASHPSFTTSYTVDIPSFIGGNVGYAGFTGGTGGLTTVADVLTWTYTFTQPGPGGGPPAPGGGPGSGVGVALIGPNPAAAPFGSAQVPVPQPSAQASPSDMVFTSPALLDHLTTAGNTGLLDEAGAHGLGAGGAPDPLAAASALDDVFRSGDMSAPF
jgi:hypothetical protein